MSVRREPARRPCSKVSVVLQRLSADEGSASLFCGDYVLNFWGASGPFIYDRFALHQCTKWRWRDCAGPATKRQNAVYPRFL